MTDEGSIGEGDLLPQFSLATPEGGVLTLHDFAGRPAVLFFYPKDDTPGCTSEARDFSDLRPEFDEIGVTLLGISKDPADRHRKFIAKHGLAVPLASDLAEPGLADALGIWVDKSMYGKTYKGMSRTTFLVDGAGRIVRTWLKVKVKGHAAEVLAAARALHSKA
ncbi:peroxiredoxin [Porphyrobacter sp. GA68]|uniref:peroxiredoxin n=1 Tax=Porphyrobacter sp. GA68 TaxID=2883480 RepID=UPI001D17E80D|nr:peroxiredoxin [Porphyrobacter sp. GA68]